MWSYEKLIFRGVPTKYAAAPLAASALREKEIDYLEKSFLEQFGEQCLFIYKNKVNALSFTSFFTNVNKHCAWAFFLSLVHLAIKINDYPDLIKPITYRNFHTAFENYVKTSMDELPELTYEYINNIFSNTGCDDDTQMAISFTEVSYMIYGYEYFQHINFSLRGNLEYNPFPTMVLDWTTDIAVANDFSYLNNKPGIVISIEYDKYKQLLYDEWYPLIVHEDIASSVPGFTPYYDYHFLYARRNRNMQAQKGVVLFWPWEYTIAELQQNELGKKLGFSLLIDLSL